MPEETLNSKPHQDANKDNRERSNSQKQLADYEIIEPLEKTSTKAKATVSSVMFSFEKFHPALALDYSVSCSFSTVA